MSREEQNGIAQKLLEFFRSRVPEVKAFFRSDFSGPAKEILESLFQQEQCARAYTRAHSYGTIGKAINMPEYAVATVLDPIVKETWDAGW